MFSSTQQIESDCAKIMSNDYDIRAYFEHIYAAVLASGMLIPDSCYVSTHVLDDDS